MSSGPAGPVVEGTLPGAADLAAQDFYRPLLESMTEGVSLSTDSGIIVYANPAEEQMFGYAPGELIGKHVSSQNAYPAAENERIVAEVVAQLKQSGSWRGEWHNRRKDGTDFFTSSRITTVELGASRYFLCVQRDVTASLKQAAALKASEERLERVVDQLPVGVIIARLPDGDILIYNRQAEELMGHPVLDARVEEYGRYGALHADGSPYAPEEYPTARALLKGETVVEEELRYRRGDGRTTWLSVNAAPVQGADGHPDLAVCTFTDIAERKAQEEHQRLLINELNHRVKNMLAIVQGLAQQSLKADLSPVEARQAFEARLAALASAHDLLTRQDWSSALLGDVVAASVAPVLGICEGRLRIAGPDVALSAQTAVNIAMALHELGTNAVKYGALSTENGAVEIEWSVSGEEPYRRLRFSWSERGGPPVAPPTRRGFGSRMIERALASELKAEVSLQFPPEGLVCTFDAPLAGLV